MSQLISQRLNEIIRTSFKILKKKIANGGVIAKNEASFQLEFSYILKTIGQLYEFHPDDKFHLELEKPIVLNEKSIKSKTKNARIDIYVEFRSNGETIKSAIELKFFKKANHREPNNRYDVFKDLSNLEEYKGFGINICYFCITTDHAHYVNQEKYSLDTSDFDFRDGKKYRSNTIMTYRTAKPYGDPIKLKGNYNFNWNQFGDLFFMLLEIK